MPVSLQQFEHCLWGGGNGLFFMLGDNHTRSNVLVSDTRSMQVQSQPQLCPAVLVHCCRFAHSHAIHWTFPLFLLLCACCLHHCIHTHTCTCLQLRGISTGKPAHIKACFAMRGALELLDFEDASINDMKRMLLQVRHAQHGVETACGTRHGLGQGGGTLRLGVGKPISTALAARCTLAIVVSDGRKLTFHGCPSIHIPCGGLSICTRCESSTHVMWDAQHC